VCGIYGLFRTQHRVTDAERVWAEKAMTLLEHRGPDGNSCVERLEGRCLLGHTRLAIIDLVGGAQPLTNEDKTVWVVCNGEIYNYVELRVELLARGHRFRTQSDCEVLTHLYEEKGDALVEDLDGMYAFAILDERKERILLARDRFGEKPLYWAPLDANRGVAFASELKALLPFPGVDRQLDVPALAQFLALRYIPAPRTHLKGIRKLKAGEIISFDAVAGTHCRRFWQLEIPPDSEAKGPTREEARQEIHRCVRNSVRLRLRSDVPVGAFLSGGIDSTYIACIIRELLPGAQFSTFCASFDDKQLDEAPYARVVAEKIDSQHFEVHFRSEELLEVFDALIDHFDEPFADVSMFPTFAVCRAARSHCKVMLSGDGGDECFAGYREFFLYYRWHFLRRTWGINSLAGAVAANWKETRRGIGPLNFLSRNDWQLLYPVKQYAAVLNCFLPEFRGEAEIGLQELEHEAQYHARLRYPGSAIEATATGYLPEQILVKVDRASMRSALECRAPFLDASLMEYVMRLPQAYHFRHGQGKALLREALPQWIPPQIRWREKRGFTPPLSTWLRTSLRERAQQTLSEFPTQLRHIVDPRSAMDLYRQHQAGIDHSDQLFRWIVLAKRCGGTSDA
jgi:asparagine synthase (glutamine-hydrolysing)